VTIYALRAGKPSWYVASHLGQRSLQSLWGGLTKSQPFRLVRQDAVWSHMAGDVP